MMSRAKTTHVYFGNSTNADVINIGPPLCLSKVHPLSQDYSIYKCILDLLHAMANLRVMSIYLSPRLVPTTPEVFI